MKKGGLTGLAAVTIGLCQDVRTFILKALLTPYLIEKAGWGATTVNRWPGLDLSEGPRREDPFRGLRYPVQHYKDTSRCQFNQVQ